MNRPTSLKPPKDAAAVLVLYVENVNRIRAWYRRSSTHGREHGHVYLAELLLGHVTDAMTLAVEGKTWREPDHVP